MLLDYECAQDPMPAGLADELILLAFVAYRSTLNPLAIL
jgi:hypothetical protein